LSRVCVHSAIAQTSSVLRSQLLFGDQALWHPGAVPLTVDTIVEYPPQRGNHPGSVGFGVASGHEWSGQTGASQPFLSNSGGPSRIHKTPSCVRDRSARSAGVSAATRCGGRPPGTGTGGTAARGGRGAG